MIDSFYVVRECPHEVDLETIYPLYGSRYRVPQEPIDANTLEEAVEKLKVVQCWDTEDLIITEFVGAVKIEMTFNPDIFFWVMTLKKFLKFFPPHENGPEVYPN